MRSPPSPWVTVARGSENERKEENTRQGKEEDTFDKKIFISSSLVVQWYLVLHQILVERARESDCRIKCRCLRAEEILKKCANIKRDLSHILEKGFLKEVYDRTEKKKENEEFVSELTSKIEGLGHSLRTSISIQIPAKMSSSSEALKNRALKLVLPKYDKSKVVVWCGSRDTVIEAIDGVMSSVAILFNTENCNHEENEQYRMPITIPDPLSGVADLGMSDTLRGCKRRMSGDCGNTKHKRFRAARKSMEGVEGIRPYPKKPLPPSPEVLSLLERKTKVVKADGLREFVMWKQAYRGEKERHIEMEKRSKIKFLEMMRRRRKFPFQSFTP